MSNGDGLRSMSGGRWIVWILGALIVFGCASRFVFLDADPGLFKHIGDVGDEGYWAFAARNMAYYQQFRTDEYVQAGVAPLYAVLGVPVYWLLSVSLFSTRFLPAMFAVLSVLVVYRIVRPLDVQAALVSAAVLALDHKWFVYSRIGQTDIPASFFALLAYERLLKKKTFAAGICFGLAVAMKLTAFLMGGAFALGLWWLYLRGDLRLADIWRFAFGAAVIGAGLGGWMVYEADILRPTYGMLADRGVELVEQPARVLADFFMTPTFGYPSAALLLTLVGAYSSKVNAAALVRFSPRAALKRLEPLDIAVLSWVLGYSISLMLASDMNSRRFNYLSIPLAIIPALLMLKRPPAAAVPSRLWERALSFAPVIILGILVGRPVLERRFPPLTALAGAAAISALIVGLLIAWENRSAARALANVSNQSAWVLVSTLSFLNILFIWLLPLVGVTSRPAQLAVAAGWIAFIGVFAWSSRRQWTLTVVMLAALNGALITSELAMRTYSIRDNSQRLLAVVRPNDFVMGSMAFQLSFNGPFHPLLWWPEFGINTVTAGQVKPRFLIRREGEVVAKPRTPDEPAFFSPEPRDHELHDIGVSSLSARFQFEMYPVRGKPRARYTLYELRY